MNSTQHLKPDEDWTKSFYEIYETQKNVDEGLINQIRYHECDDIVAKHRQLITLIWYIQTTLIVNCTISDQNLRAYYNDGNTLLGSGSLFSPSFNKLLLKLAENKTWKFEEKRYFQIESDQFRMHMRALLKLMDSITGYKTSSSSLTQLLCINMSEICLDINDSEEKTKTYSKLSITDVPLHSRLNRLNQIRTLHRHLVLGYEGETSHQLIVDHNYLPNTLRDALENFLLIVSSFYNACSEEIENNTLIEKRDVDIKTHWTNDAETRNKPNPDTESIRFSDCKAYDRLVFLVSNSERLRNTCKNSSPSTVTNILEAGLNDIQSCLKITNHEEITILTSKLHIYSGLLAYNISSATGKIDLAEYINWTSKLMEFGIEKSFTDIMAYDTCKSLIPSKMLMEQGIEDSLQIDCYAIKKATFNHPLQEEKRILLADNLKSNAEKRDILIKEMPKRHQDESFKKLHEELVELRKSNLMEPMFLQDIMNELLQNCTYQDIDNKFQVLIAKIKTWEDSVSRFTKNLRCKYSSFEDIVLPILWGISMTIQGVKSLTERFEKRRYLPSKPDIMNCIIKTRDTSKGLVSSACKHEFNFGIKTSNIHDKLEISRLLYHSWRAKVEEEEENSEEDTIIYKFNRDPDENVFENETDGHLKQLSRQISTDISLISVLEDEQKYSGLSSIEFLKRYDELMSSIQSNLSESRYLASDYIGKDVVYELHCRSLIEGIKLLSGKEVKFSIPESKSIKKQVNVTWIEFCNDLQELRGFVNSEICPHYSPEENSIVRDIVQSISSIISRRVNEFIEKPYGFLVPIDNLIVVCLEWNKNAPRNQVIPVQTIMSRIRGLRQYLYGWLYVTTECENFLLDETQEVAFSALIAQLEMSMNGQNEETADEYNTTFNNKEKRNSLSAPFILFFTSAFLGDFTVRLQIVRQLAKIYSQINEYTAALIYTVYRYFAVYEPNIQNALFAEKKALKQKFEVVFKTGKLFIGDDKFNNHFKEATKFKRSSTVDYLKLLKQPAMRFCQQPKLAAPCNETNTVVTNNHLSTGTFSNVKKVFEHYKSHIFHIMPLKEDICQNIAAIDHDHSFVTSKGTIIAENEQQMYSLSLKKAIQASEKIMSFVHGLEKTLDDSREQINVLLKELSEKKEKPCAFHPTQKSIQNICAEMKNEFGLSHQRGGRYQLSSSAMLGEIGMSEVLSSGHEVIGHTLLQALSSFDDFSAMILHSNMRGNQGDTRPLSASQRGYYTLSHGMIEVVKLISSKRTGLFGNISSAAEVSNALKTCYRLSFTLNKAPASCNDVYDYITRLINTLNIQDRYCNEIVSTCKEVSVQPSTSEKTNEFIEVARNRLSGDSIKQERIITVLEKYQLQICNMKQECNLILLSNTIEAYDRIVALSTISSQAQQEYKNLFGLLPHNGLGIIPSEFRQLNSQISNEILTTNKLLKNVSHRKIMDKNISLLFMRKVRSTTEKCLLAIQETHLKAKELNEDLSLEISSKTSKYDLKRIIDLLLGILKALRLDQVRREVNIHKKILEDAHKLNMDLSPLVKVLSENYAIFADSYLLKLVIPTLQSIIKVLEKLGLYFGDAADVFKSFLNYKFPSKEKEDDKKSDDTKNDGSNEVSDGCGLGDDEGTGNAEATTKDLESEDIFDTAQKPGEEQNSNEDPQKETKEEDGVEMSEGLENEEMQNIEENAADNSDDNDSSQSDEDEQMDVEEGKTDEGNELLDEDVWNDDGKADDTDNNTDDSNNKEKDNNKNNQVKDQKGVDEDESDPNDVNDTGDENKRKRENEEPENPEGEEEVEMNDPLYREEETIQEPEEMPDLSELEDGGINEELGEDDSGDEQMESEIIDQKLPDFEEEKQDEEIPELDKPSDDVTNNDEQAAGHDRDNASNSNENDSSDKKPEKSDKVEPNTNESVGTEKEGLLDENASQNNNKEAGNENEEDQENDNVDAEESMDKDIEDKYMESTDCSGVQRMQIVNKLEEDANDKPTIPKIFEHVSDRDDDCVKTIDRVDERDHLKKPNSDQNNENEDIPMDINDKELENVQNVKPNLTDEDLIKTYGPQRGSDDLIIGEISKDMSFNSAPKLQMSTTLETQYRQNVHNACNKSISEWLNICGRTRSLSSSLSEQLRLILEPTKATKFKGDFRTGKRLNMRKIIPYIASGFRKDRIWLRRTKPSAREYQVIVALDDSSSMKENAVRKTAYNSLAIICQALSTLDVGKFGILGFGNQAKMVQPLQTNFSPEDGAHVLNTFTFEQTSTNVASMLLMARKAFSECSFVSSSSSVIFEKLLIIVSDGRGIFNEGKETVLESVRSAKLENIFIIFLIVENLGSEEADNRAKDSILDLRIASFDNNGIPTVVPYIEEFPFSNYVILR